MAEHGHRNHAVTVLSRSASPVVGLILLAVIAVTPLALMPGLFLSHDVIPKAILILTGAAGLLLMSHQWTRAIGMLWSTAHGRIFLCLVLAQSFSLLLSTAFSSQPNLSLTGTVWRRFGMVEQLAILVIATALACYAVRRPAWAASLMR